MHLTLSVEVLSAPAWFDVSVEPAQDGSIPMEAPVNSNGLEPGEYGATIRVSSPETRFEPKVVNVTLRVLAPPAEQ